MSEPDLVLALDLATIWGWALLTLDGDLLAWDSETAKPTKELGRWSRFRQTLSTVVTGETIERLAVMVVEDAQGLRWKSMAAARVVFGMHALAEHWADQRGVVVKRVPMATVKRLATGSGSASKPDVCRACAARFPNRGFEGLLEAEGPFDGSDATAVGLAYLELRGGA